MIKFLAHEVLPLWGKVRFLRIYLLPTLSPSGAWMSSNSSIKT